MVLVVLLARPELVFRGTYTQLLEYIKKPVTTSNKGAIQAAIQGLLNRGYVLFMEDEEDFFILGLKRKAEKTLVDIHMDLVKKCYNIAEENHKRDWVPLLKVYAAATLLKTEEPYTVDRLASMTNLSTSALKDSKRLLKENNMVIFNKQYVDGTCFCTGSQADVNAIY